MPLYKCLIVKKYILFVYFIKTNNKLNQKVCYTTVPTHALNK